MSLVVGTDGAIPIYDPEGRWTIWAIDEIFTGQAAKGKFVPKVKDYVRDPLTYETWIVDHLDPVTFIPTLRLISAAVSASDVTQSDVIFGVGPGPGLDTYRAFLNTTVFPHTLALDQRFMPKGSMNSYAKVFLGTDTTAATGKVISKVYDASGQFVSDAVPLELVAVDSHTNYTAKSVKRCNTTEEWPNGERITCVIYSDDGHVTERRGFLIENTDTIMDSTTPLKYITDISLESIFLSQTTADQLEFPLNVPMDALNLFGIVHYSDGSTLRLPVDGTKFSILGLEGRLATVVGQPTDLVLRYTLAKNEYAYASSGANNGYIAKPYRIVTNNPNNSIAVKLFGYPVYVSDALGYEMHWFLLNLDRNVWYEVTNYVQWSDQTGPFNPKQYGYLQRKSVSLNLRDVSPTFIPFIHAQTVDIYLVRAPDANPVANWTVGTEASDQYPRFGQQVYGKLNGALVNFGAGLTTQADWLTQYYAMTRPLIDVTKEVNPPVPTHFQVDYNGTVTEWSIDDWNTDLAISVTPKAYDTVFIRFIKRTASGDLILSYAAALLKAF